MRAQRVLAVVCSWVVVVSSFAACGHGSKVDVSDYDQSCTQDSECVPVLDGEIPCCNNECDDNAAINTSSLAQYDADVEARAPSCGEIACLGGACTTPVAACKTGRCVLILAP